MLSDEPITKEEILEFLRNLGIKAESIDLDGCNFSRTIEFEIYGIIYNIIWFCNESTLRIGDDARSACIPFKYMYFDTTYPLVNGNKSIGFSYTKNECIDTPYLYEIFRIPLELEDQNGRSK
ncbi:MAG: hypothetical protein KAR20_11930 [Candidatus Heimdallarchaeota archaeon]|nr:hypothetical protein [Candidatus Heimdallarchaeota archaeon]MCK5606784.1 hypothetical protein [Candidatus Pacearchaeota archaeon]